MKNIFKAILPVIALGASLTSCSKWTETEAQAPYVAPKSAEYFENLRAYKKSDHPVSFGWFGGWTATGTSMASSMAGLPDSVDMISIWGNWRQPNAVKMADLRYVQKVKGTKVLMCFIISSVGDQLDGGLPAEYLEEPLKYWADSTNGDLEQPGAMAYAARKYARAIIDTINLYGYDGFDIDYEPNYGARGNLAYPYKNMIPFVEELAKYIGPSSGTDRILAIDGEPDRIPAAVGHHFNYYISQAYSCSSYSNLNSRMASIKKNLGASFSTKKYIVTENFESLWRTGGATFTDQWGKKVPSLLGMAAWNPAEGRKGGVGTFHMEYEFPHDPDYKYLRAAIQIQNPAVH